MNKRIIGLVLISLILCAFSASTVTADKYNPVGKWKFSAVGAPYGYEEGVIVITREKKEYSGSMTFPGIEYKFPLESITFVDKQLGFNVYVEGEEVLVVLNFSEKDKLSGKAVYSQGELTMTAERVKDE